MKPPRRQTNPTKASAELYLAHVSESPVHACRFLRCKGQPARWLFLSQEQGRLVSWETALGLSVQRVDISRTLDSVAASLRRPYVDWVDELSNRYGDRPGWWFTSLEERNTITSPFFLHLCYLMIAKQLLLDAQDRTVHVVVAESWALVKAIEALCGDRVKIRRRGGWLPAIAASKKLARVAAVWGKYTILCLRRFWAARSTAGWRRPWSTADVTEDTLVYTTFFHDSSLSPDGRFRDRYMPSLQEWLLKQGYAVRVLPIMYDIRQPYRKVYRWMRESAASFIIPDDWLTLADYVAAPRCALHWLFAPATAPALAGLDVTHLLAEERWRSIATRDLAETFLLSRALGRLGKAGFRTSAVIGWFENIRVDKAVQLGCRTAFPEATRVGVYNLPIYPNWLACLPSPAECDAGVVPNLVVCGGPTPRDVLHEWSRGKLKTEVGPALRYAYLWETGATEQTPAGHRPIVLVGLPSRLDESVELLLRIQPLWRERSDVTWLVKPHPDYPAEDLMGSLGDPFPEQCALTAEAMRDLLRRADVVMGAGSGSLLEAAALGKPVIRLGRPTALNYDPLELAPTVPGRLCHGIDEIAARLRECLRLDATNRRELGAIGQLVRSAFFAPVSDGDFSHLVESMGLELRQVEAGTGQGIKRGSQGISAAWSCADRSIACTGHLSGRQDEFVAPETVVSHGRPSCLD